MTPDEVTQNASDWAIASEDAVRSGRVQLFGGIAALPLLVVVVALFGETVTSGAWQYVVMAVAAIAIGIPASVLMLRTAERRQLYAVELVADLEKQLRGAVRTAEGESERRAVQVRRQEFESRLANALEMADDEPEVLDAVERALGLTLPERPAELLLADNSHAHLTRMAVSTSSGEAPDCPVASPDQCPAARRAQVQQFNDSAALDACPKLRDRVRGRCSAVCVPVSIMGRTVGVIHATGETGATVDDSTVADLSTLSKLAGARIGLLRVMAETELQAATDSLTGLMNRRSFENRMRVLRTSGTPVVIAMADLDHFKDLNDTHGHETGDRALRLFAHVLKTSLRKDDLIARHGGEEFTVALPSCPVDEARSKLDTARESLTTAAAAAGLPPFTVSFGVVDAGVAYDDLAEVLTRADVALFEAKRAGRNRVVVGGIEDGLLPTPPVEPSALERIHSV